MSTRFEIKKVAGCVFLIVRNPSKPQENHARQLTREERPGVSPGTVQ